MYMFGLESNVFLEAHVCHVESFVIGCLLIIIGVSVREKKCHTTMHMRQSRRKYPSQHFLHLSNMPEDGLPRMFLVCVPPGWKHSARRQKC